MAEITYDQINSLPDKPALSCYEASRTGPFIKRQGRAARYDPVLRGRLKERFRELIAAKEVPNAIIRIMRSEGYTKADGTELDHKWYQNTKLWALAPTRGQAAIAHLDTKNAPMGDFEDSIEEDPLTELAHSVPEGITFQTEHATIGLPALAVAIIKDPDLSAEQKVEMLQVYAGTT